MTVDTILAQGRVFAFLRFDSTTSACAALQNVLMLLDATPSSPSKLMLQKWSDLAMPDPPARSCSMDSLADLDEFVVDDILLPNLDDDDCTMPLQGSITHHARQQLVTLSNSELRENLRYNAIPLTSKTILKEEHFKSLENDWRCFATSSSVKTMQPVSAFPVFSTEMESETVSPAEHFPKISLRPRKCPGKEFFGVWLS